jgi:hypothetical protein
MIAQFQRVIYFRFIKISRFLISILLIYHAVMWMYFENLLKVLCRIKYYCKL